MSDEEKAPMPDPEDDVADGSDDEGDPLEEEEDL